MSSSLDVIQTREEAVEFLEGYSLERGEELGERRSRAPLLKSYLLETARQGKDEPNLAEVFWAAGARLDPLRGGMFKVWDVAGGRYVGFLEPLLPRHPVFYTNELARFISIWVRDLVARTPFLDHVSLSGRVFNTLWGKVVAINPGTRYGRLVFEHRSVFEADSGYPEESEDEVPETEGDEEPPDQELAQNDEVVRERRSSRFTVVDRLDVLSAKLPELQRLYEPLYCICQLRFPAARRGGHDFYHNGKVTNRSDSFTDHRLHLLYVLRIYKEATENAENMAWYSQETTRGGPGTQFSSLRGAPVVMRFSHELTPEVFTRWIASMFSRRDTRFRLWGTPIWVTPATVHVYGADRHLWQPIFLELTRRHVVAVLPQGTCGNTIHRLVANIQRFVDPAVDAWVGDEPYDEFTRVAAERPAEGLQ